MNLFLRCTPPPHKPITSTEDIGPRDVVLAEVTATPLADVPADGVESAAAAAAAATASTAAPSTRADDETLRLLLQLSTSPGIQQDIHTWSGSGGGSGGGSASPGPADLRESVVQHVRGASEMLAEVDVEVCTRLPA